MQFARWLCGNIERNEKFLLPFVIGDEAAFAMTSTPTTSESMQLHDNHLNSITRLTSVARDKLTVWIGLCGNGQIIGQFFFERNVTGQVYLQMINNDVVPQLEQYFRRQIGGVFRNL